MDPVGQWRQGGLLNHYYDINKERSAETTEHNLLRSRVWVINYLAITLRWSYLGKWSPTVAGSMTGWLLKILVIAEIKKAETWPGGGGWVEGGSHKWQSERQDNRRALIFKARATAADWLTVSGRENDWAGVWQLWKVMPTKECWKQGGTRARQRNYRKSQYLISEKQSVQCIL